MNVLRHTNSLCPQCYREIPAMITSEPAGVLMTKFCPAHGKFTDMVERDQAFYLNVMENKPGIYPGYFVDVTRRCNLRCEYCYYPLEHKDPDGLFTIDSVLSECATNVHHAPFVLTGGEPTVRKDIVTLINRAGELGAVEMLTNGVVIADEHEFERISMPLMRDNGICAIHLSAHPQNHAWTKVIGYVAERSMTIGSVLIVVDSKDQFLEALRIAERIGPLALCVRIKAATRIWNEQKPNNKIFVSDMLGWLPGEFTVLKESGNKSVFVNVAWRGIWLMLVSWHDVGNVDLLDIDCPPYYRARNGQVANFVTSGLINEGMQKGFLNGQRIPYVPTFDQLNASAAAWQSSPFGMP